MRKAKLSPSFVHYLQGIGQEDLIVTTLVGHLVIEALIVEIIQLKVNDDTPWKWSFPQKTKKCYELGFITEQMQLALNKFNDLRNDYSHILGHQVSFDELFDLCEELGRAGFDFSDTTIYVDKIIAKERYQNEDLLIEILNSVFFDLAYILSEAGGANHCGG